MTDYERIAKTITYIKDNFQHQPSLEQIAEEVYLSAYHFQRLFKEWAGVSPKKFLQYISIQHAKDLLRKNESLAQASYETGLSGPSRLHDLFIAIEGMTPGEFKQGGKSLDIHYQFFESTFGQAIIASTAKGICYLAFSDNAQSAIDQLQQKFPNARYYRGSDPHQENAIRLFRHDCQDLPRIKLHLKASPFQLKVWEALLKIPFGQVSSYAGVARAIGHVNASRAVGSAIGDNPVAFLIPCHRVIKSTGIVGEYHWGNVRKTAMLAWESGHIYGESISLATP